MTAERWHRIEELFAGAMEQPAQARDSFLASACGSDADLYAEVSSLVQGAPMAAARLQGIVSSAIESLALDAAATYAGKRMGPYRLIQVLGAGGMGTVYLAERDDDQFRRKVAIKVLHAWLASPELVARFRDERQILAALDHPSIVRLLDGGSTPEGLPYYVMEHVEGEPCSAYARSRPVRARIDLVLRICVALQYSHQKLVVHRDIKPSNILVGPDGAPKLLDFGIAKLLDRPADGRQGPTRTGMLLFTPEYASPEQARGEPATVATDIYSLGAVLYELLVGQTPVRPGADAFETLKRICEIDPPRPSTVAPARLRRELGGDLDSIVLKALQKLPAQRYGSVAELAADLSSYLADRPVSAREATLGYRARKFTRRHRGALAVAALVAGTLSVLTVLSVGQARRAERERRTLLLEQGRQEMLLGHAGRALPYLAEILRAGDDTPAIRFLLAEAIRPFQRELVAIRDPTGGIRGIAWSPHGDRFAATSFGGTTRVYDVGGKLLFALHGKKDDPGAPLFSPDGSLLTTVSSEMPPLVWNAATGELLAPLTLPDGEATGDPAESGNATITSFGASGRQLRVAASDGRVHVWDLVVGKRVASIRADTKDDRIIGGVLSPDGRQLFVGLARGPILVFDVASGHRAATLAGDATEALGELVLEIARDGTRLYTAGPDSKVRIWDIAARTQVAVLPSSSGPAYGRSTFFELSRDGTKLLSTGMGGAPMLVDARTGKFLTSLHGEGDRFVTRAHFSPDGQRIVTISVSESQNVRLWDTATGTLDTLIEIVPSGGDAPGSWAGGALDARFSPDGTLLLTASATELQLWRTGREPLLAEALTDATGGVTNTTLSASFSPDEQRVLSVGKGAAICDLANARCTTLDVNAGWLWSSSWSRDGRRMLLVGENAFARIYDAGDLRVFVPLVGHRGSVNCGSFSPDGTRALTAGADGTARVWDVTTGEQLIELRGHTDRVVSATWSPNGQEVATSGGGTDRTLRVWEAATGQPILILRGHASPFLDVSFRPDGRRLVSGSRNGQAEIWDLATGARLLAFNGHSGPVAMVRFSPDGALLATGSYDGTARIWDAETGKSLGTRVRGGMGVYALAFNRNGDSLMTASQDGVRLWDVTRDAQPVPSVVEFVNRRAPWQLVDGRLELVIRGPSSSPPEARTK